MKFKYCCNILANQYSSVSSFTLERISMSLNNTLNSAQIIPVLLMYFINGNRFRDSRQTAPYHKMARRTPLSSHKMHCKEFLVQKVRWCILFYIHISWRQLMKIKYNQARKMLGGFYYPIHTWLTLPLSA